MMNCTEFYKMIDDYCDGELNAERQVGFDAHRASCTTCQALMAAEDSMLASLKAMPVVGPSEGFIDRALHKAVESNVGHHQRHGFLVGFGSAAAAVMALWVVVGWFPSEVSGPSQVAVAPQQAPQQQAVQQQVASSSVPELSIALSEERNVKLAFYSVKALQGARITIQIPENVALVGYPGQRELSWQVNLVEGDNFLRLPLKAMQAMDGQLVARIEHGSKVKTLRVNLKVGSEGLSWQGMLIEQVV